MITGRKWIDGSEEVLRDESKEKVYKHTRSVTKTRITRQFWHEVLILQCGHICRGDHSIMAKDVGQNIICNECVSKEFGSKQHLLRPS